MDEEARRVAPVPRHGHARRAGHGGHLPKASLSVGDVFARTFATTLRHLPVLLLVAFVVFAPLALFNLWRAKEAWGVYEQARAEAVTVPAGAFWSLMEQKQGWVGVVLGYLLPLVLAAVVTFGVFQHLGGRPFDYGRSLGRGLARLLPVVGVAIVLSLLMFGVMFVAMIPIAMILNLRGSAVALVLGVIMMLAAVLVPLCTFLVSMQVAVVEDAEPFKALARSARLTAGVRWRIFGILILLFVAIALVVGFLQRGLFARPETWGAAVTGTIVLAAVTAAISLLQAVGSAVIYHDLRLSREGVGLDDLLRVFD